MMALGRTGMEVCVIVILSNVVIISFLLYSKIYINLKYRRDNSNDDLVVEVYMFKRLLAYRMEIPVIEIKNIENSLWLKYKIKTGQSKDQTKLKREQRFVPKTMNFYLIHPGKLRYVFRLFRYCTHLYYRLMGTVITALYCEKFEWRTGYGSEDAAITGIVTGMLWTGKASMITRLKKHVIFTNKPIICVNPIFGTNSLKVDFQCIFSIRLGNVINAIRNLYEAK